MPSFKYDRILMLRERNTFVLKARSGNEERQHALTLHVNMRNQDLAHFNGRNSSVSGVDNTVQRLLELLDGDEAFQSLIREMDDLRQLDQLVKTKSKDRVHTLQLPDVTVQWQVVEEPGLPSVLVRVNGNDSNTRSTPRTSDSGGKYRPLPVRKVVVAVWMYPPHVEIPSTGDRIPAASNAANQDFFHES